MLHTNGCFTAKEWGKDMWDCFDYKTHTELTSAERWAIVKAAKQMGAYNEFGRNCWMWTDGELCQYFYDGDHVVQIWHLGVSRAGLFMLTTFDSLADKTGVYHIELDL